MAEKEEIKHEQVTEKVVTRRRSPKWVVWVVISVVAVYLILMVGGLLLFRAIQNNIHGMNGVGQTSLRQVGRGPQFSNQRTYNVRSDSSDGLTTTSTNTTYTETDGVITAVNGDNIVVAGGGKTQTITTNSSTTYDNGTKPAVNDSVVVVGTESGTTITATEVRVLN